MKTFRNAAPVVLAALAPLAAAQTYHATDFGSFGGNAFQVVGINASGTVLGNVTVSNVTHPFVYGNGQLTNLPTFGGASTVALDFNDAGQIVGRASGSGTSHGFLYSGGAYDNVGTSYEATAINNAGAIAENDRAGAYNFGNAYLYQNGTATPLAPDPPEFVTQSSVSVLNDHNQAAGFTYVGGDGRGEFWSGGGETSIPLADYYNDLNGINESGTVVGTGTYSNLRNTRAFVWSPGQQIKFITATPGYDVLGTGMSFALGVNDLGAVVGGVYNDPGGYGIIQNPDAFLYQNGNSVALTPLLDAASSGWSLISASGINDAGQIAGVGTLNGQTHAFLLTPNVSPVPEPASLALLGLGALATLRRRKGK